MNFTESRTYTSISQPVESGDVPDRVTVFETADQPFDSAEIEYSVGEDEVLVHESFEWGEGRYHVVKKEQIVSLIESGVLA